MGRKRVVGHIDLDYFYAQVEELSDPTLKERPVLVCVYSGRTEDSGVISTTNYKARGYGVKSGMPISLAKRRLANVDAAFIKMDHEKYESVSERIMGRLKPMVDVLEQTGIDEWFFDVTVRSGTDFRAARSLAVGIKGEIFRSEGLTCSIGLAPNKVIAKMASDFVKPDGLTVVEESEVSDFLRPLPVDSVYGVGSKTSQILHDNAIDAVGQLAEATMESLERWLGRRLAVYLLNVARGINDEPVVERRGSTQMSRVITLKSDSRDSEVVLKQFDPAVEDLHDKVVAGGLVFKSLAVIGIFSDLTIKTRNKTFDIPTDSLAMMKDTGGELLRQLIGETELDLRRVGMKVAEFSDVSDQASLSSYMEG